MKLVLIGSLKQTSQNFPMENMQSKYFTCMINSYGFISEDGNEGVPEMMVFSWVEHDRKYLITPIESLEGRLAVLIYIWNQVDEDVNYYSHMVYLETLQNLSLEI